MKRLPIVLFLLLLLPLTLRANQATRGWCEDGAQPVVTAGLNSTTQVQQSFPQCTITVFVHGGGLASIFSDNSGTVLANPFTAQLNGQWQFYAANGRYDVQMSGAGFPTSVTYSDILLTDPVASQALIPNTALAFSATPTFAATNNVSYSMTLTGNVTSSSISGTPANGNILSLTLVEDATGGRTMVFPGNFILPLGFAFNTAATATNALTFKFDGTNWNLISFTGSGGAGGSLGPAVNRTASYTAVTGDNGKFEIFNGATLTLTLPNPPPSSTWTIGTKNGNITTLTISANGLTIDGNALESLNQGSSVTIYTDGVNYFTDPGNIAASTPTINAIYASPNCPNPTPANCFQIFNDVQVTVDAIYSGGSTTVGTQSTDPAFVSTDAGKIEFGTFNCPGTVSNCNDNCPQGTISSVTDAHHVVVSIACTNNSSAGAHTNNFFWGHDDGSTLVNAFNVTLSGSGSANSQRENLFLSCGMTFTSVNPFIVPNGARNINGGVSGCGGGGATIIVPLPKMNCNTTGSVPGSISGCLISDLSQPLENPGNNAPGWVFKDITFWGGGTDVKDAAATYSNPAVGISTNLFDSLVDVYVIGWVWNNATPVIGMQNSGSQWYQSGSVAGGTTSCQLAGIVSVPAVMFGGQCGGSFTALAGSASMKINSPASGGTNIVDTNGVYFNQGGQGVTNAGGAGTVYYSKGDHMTVCFQSQSGITFLTGTTINQFGSGCAALTVSGGVVHLSSVSWLSSGGTFVITGGTIYDDCGVVIPQTGTPGTFSGGSVIGACSLPENLTNTAVASRNTSLASTTILSTLRLPYSGPINFQIYAYDSAAGSGCAGNTTVTWTVSYTDPTGNAQTSTATETIITNGGSTGGDAMKVTMPININANTAVTYSTTYTVGSGCVTGPSYAANLKMS